jgi:hypothetical protein
MTSEEITVFLDQASPALVGVVATIRADSSPNGAVTIRGQAEARTGGPRRRPLQPTYRQRPRSNTLLA